MTAACKKGGLHELRQTIDVESEAIQTEKGPAAAVHSGIRLSIYSPRPNDMASEEPTGAATSAAPMPVFHYGDRLRFTAKLKRPRNFRNPGAFDYQGYLADRGIAPVGSAKIENVERLPGSCTSRACPDSAVAAGSSWRA